jgi:BRCT domain type II-containing protein
VLEWRRPRKLLRKKSKNEKQRHPPKPEKKKSKDTHQNKSKSKDTHASPKTNRFVHDGCNLQSSQVQAVNSFFADIKRRLAGFRQLK